MQEGGAPVMGGSDDWGDWSGPSAEELLRQEYPDLMDKWTDVQKKEAARRTIEEQLINFNMIERLLQSRSFIHVFNRWEKSRDEYWEAEEEYLFLEKLLKDY